MIPLLDREDLKQEYAEAISITENTDTSDKMTLFHIDYFHHDPIQTFIPRIPAHRASGEDDTVSRICTALTIEGCIHAHPDFIDRLNQSDETHEFFDPYAQMSYMQMFLEQGIAGYLMRVYHFEVDRAIVCADDTLQEFGYVPDAHLNGEHWILEACSPTKISYLLVWVHDFDEAGVPNFPNYRLFDSIEEMGVNMEYLDFHSAIYRLHNPKELMVKVFTKDEALSFIEADKQNLLDELARCSEIATATEATIDQEVEDFFANPDNSELLF